MVRSYRRDWQKILKMEGPGIRLAEMKRYVREQKVPSAREVCTLTRDLVV
jgi:hypothetical protein